MDKPLIVYKASAGSGKTFTLATEYIKLLIKNPSDYRSILGVTFTNKATEEMKNRILSQLYGIWKRLDDSKPYIDAVCRGLDVSEKFASTQAGLALHLLLHNYNGFRIETIDSFFQSILRNLARELDLTANLRVELNDAQIEEQAVDELIDGLSTNDELLRWILKYIKDNISEDKGWNVINSIKTFGKTIFKDFYKEAQSDIACKLSDSVFFDEYKKKLYACKDYAQKRMSHYADDFFRVVSEEGLSADSFSYKERGVYGFFKKLSEGIFDEKVEGNRVRACIDAPEKWASANGKERSRVCTVATERLIGILSDAIKERPHSWRVYKSADLTLRHLSQLRLLERIDKKVRELNAESNRFLLSDTQYLLASLISDSDTPFIYEKIGSQLNHIMIDEFQDTSSVQWRNFKVLLLDSMSKAHSRNIIVGDVKQSIYRWRDSDWRLLNNISREFAHPEEQIEIKTLEMNYRSQRNIVMFNNAFFSKASILEYDNNKAYDKDAAMQIPQAYKDVEQSIPDSRPGQGFIEIELLPNEDYQFHTLQCIADRVDMLTRSGVSPNDIAIIVRTNANIQAIAKYFSENMPNVKIVSDEAYRLDASVAVNIIVNALHLLTHNDDMVSKVFLAKAYQKFICNKNFSEEQIKENGNTESFLPQKYANSIEELRSTPLYDLAEQIYYIFDLKKMTGESEYVCAFFDHLSAFMDESQPDIDMFVEAWNQSICSFTIQSNVTGGIRLITIHKSKGLEFDNVIVPFCDWQIERSNKNVIWCKPDSSPYNELPLVPIDQSKALMGTIYEKYYVQEKIQNCVDDLNLLYVAFTRAGNNLFVFGKRDAKNSRSSLIQECLPHMEMALDGACLEGVGDENTAISFKFGSVAVCEKESHKSQSKNLFLMPSSIEEFTVETFTCKTEFKQSNKSREFIDGDADGEQSSNYIHIGSVLHKVFSTIDTLDDIDPALTQLETDGILSYGDISATRIKAVLRQRLSDKRVADWFSGKWELFNECSILFVDTDGQVKERRPDRVMTDGKQVVVVDFKFGSPRAGHHAQVRQYMDLLQSMGYADVKGFIWYVYDNEIEEI